LDEKRAAIITALNISNEYLKNLSNVSEDASVNESLEGLTIEVKKQVESLSFKA
jgi:cell division protein ZapA (FtsZ GTPase activity inhibitor)